MVDAGGSDAATDGGGDAGPAPCPQAGGTTMIRVPAGFCIDTREVTRAQYAAWLATSPSTAAQPSYCQFNQTFQPGATCFTSGSVCMGVNCGDQPQVCIDWCDAYAYCTAMGKRLCGKIGGGALGVGVAALDPLQSEWLNACTSGATLDWPYGPSAVAGTCNTSSQTTTPVGSLPGCQSKTPGFAGVFDMVGNVWELDGACAGPVDGQDMCIFRGGSFDIISSSSQTDKGCGTGYAYAAHRGDSSASIGFRCCAD
jgi:formylglycine-generating enzyme required for sulfatase activity